jgi:hypothetical protein
LWSGLAAFAGAGHRSLNTEALWEFAIPLANGKPVPSSVMVLFVFNL